MHFSSPLWNLAEHSWGEEEEEGRGEGEDLREEERFKLGSFLGLVGLPPNEVDVPPNELLLNVLL